MNGKLEHLKFYINYTHNRIGLVDSKCSILIAIELGFIAVITFVVDKFLLPCPYLKSIGYFVVAIGGTFSLITIIFLLKTIRPSTKFFKLKTGIKWFQSDGIMWQDLNTLVSKEEFSIKVDNLDDKTIEQDLKSMAYNHYCLIFVKYKAYRLAVKLIKIQLVLMLIAINLIWFLPKY